MQADLQNALVIGVQLQYAKGYRGAALGYILDRLPYTIKMPCGIVAEYKTWDDIPQKDTPCPCGNPKHWLIRFEEFDNRGNRINDNHKMP